MQISKIFTKLNKNSEFRKFCDMFVVRFLAKKLQIETIWRIFWARNSIFIPKIPLKTPSSMVCLETHLTSLEHSSLPSEMENDISEN